MSRNNEERTGTAPDVNVPVSPITETNTVAEGSTTPPSLGQSNAGLNFVVPTEFVDLPSRGDFYAPDHPLHNQDTIEIRHMTAREEEILTSRTLLKKGLALDRLIDSVLVDKSIKSETLLIGDKNAILVMSRILAYGREYNTKVTCPACFNQSEFSFDLMEGTISHPDDVDNPIFTRTENDTFIITLPKTKVEAEVRLLTGVDERWLSKAFERKKRAKDGTDSLLSDQMRLFIVTLNQVTDKKIINDFIGHMPASDSRFLRKAYADLSPNLDLTQDFMCPECDHQSDMEVPFTTDFFWPK